VESFSIQIAETNVAEPAEPSSESKSNILLEPQLNPILNPLLSAHMGRWAEVYFTSPPEKREQAVAELVRELARDSGSSPIPQLSTHDFIERRELAPMDLDRREPIWIEDSKAETPAAQIESIPPSTASSLRDPFDDGNTEIAICVTCEHLNGAGQKFCGMCGLPLSGNAALPLREQPEIETSADSHSSRMLTDQETTSPLADVESSKASGVAEHKYPVIGGARFGPHYDRPPRPEKEEEQVPDSRAQESLSLIRPQRWYFAAAIAMVLAVLLYVNGRDNASRDRAASPAQLTAPPPSPATAEPSSPLAPAASPGLKASSAKLTPSNSMIGHADVGAKSSLAAPFPSPQSNPIELSGPPSQNGAADLAIAEKYLNATPRNAEQAVPWLWKAVGKQNATASLALSDLYLMGVGVPKSCDQARLLLTAAARRSVAAAVKLKALQNSGCP
jgi:hypothetical protein